MKQIQFGQARQFETFSTEAVFKDSKRNLMRDLPKMNESFSKKI